jgi:hypothetical protein
MKETRYEKFNTKINIAKKKIAIIDLITGHKIFI